MEQLVTWYTLRFQGPNHLTPADTKLPLGETSVPELWIHLKKNDVELMKASLSSFAALDRKSVV